MTAYTSWMFPMAPSREREDADDHMHDTLIATIEGLEAQLQSIYEERSSPDYFSTESALESMEAQLRDLYAEREAQDGDGTLARPSASEAYQMVENLVQQIAALLEERNELSDSLDSSRMELKIHRERERSRWCLPSSIGRSPDRHIPHTRYSHPLSSTLAIYAA